MKKLLAYSAALGLAMSVNIAAPAAHAAQGGADDVAQCKAYVDMELFSSVGECQSAFRTGPVDFCKLLRSFNILGFLGYENLGQCVSQIRQFN